LTWEVTPHGWRADVGEFLALVNPGSSGEWFWEVCATDAWYDEAGVVGSLEEAKAAAELSVERLCV
jgi:hypothetical protein